MIQLCLSNQNIYCFTDEGCQYVCSRKGLFLPPMSTPGAMSLFSAQTPWTAVNRFRLSLLSLKISSYLQAGVNRTLLKTFFENHPVIMRYQLYLTSTLTLIYRAWKFWQNWECNIRCHKNSQLDCSKHLSHFSLQSCSVVGSIPPVNDFVTYPPTPGISTNILPTWVSGSLDLNRWPCHSVSEWVSYLFGVCRAVTDNDNDSNNDKDNDNAQRSEVQSQRVSKNLTCTVALQRVQSAQETMICFYL